MIKVDIKIGIDQTVELGECHIEVELSMDKTIEEGHNMIKIIENFRGTQNYRGQNFRGGYRGNFRNDNFGRGRSRSREKHYSGILGEMREAVVDLDQDQE